MDFGQEMEPLVPVSEVVATEQEVELPQFWGLRLLARDWTSGSNFGGRFLWGGRFDSGEYWAPYGWAHGFVLVESALPTVEESSLQESVTLEAEEGCPYSCGIVATSLSLLSILRQPLPLPRGLNQKCNYCPSLLLLKISRLLSSWGACKCSICDRSWILCPAQYIVDLSAASVDTSPLESLILRPSVLVGAP